MNKFASFFMSLLIVCILSCNAFAQENTTVSSQDSAVAPSQEEVRLLEPAVDSRNDQKAASQLTLAQPMPNAKYFDPVKYTLGPNDSVEISVMRHPEFSGVFPINLEGKIQYKFVGDMDVTGLTKAEMEKKKNK